MESFESYIEKFVTNAENVTYEKAATFAEIRRANDFFLRENELSDILAEKFSDRISDIAIYLESEKARVRRSVAYLLLGKMKPSREITERAIRVLEEYACKARGDETLNARGFLLAFTKDHNYETTAANDISLTSSLKKKYL